MLRKRLTLIALLIALVLCTCFASCGAESDTPQTIILATPSVAITNDGVAQWNAVENATEYRYKINGGFTKTTTELSVKLELGQSIQVKAVGDRDKYLDSDFSEPKTYTTSTIDTPCSTHKDDDKNGVCDVCNISVLSSISFIALNDLHGKFNDTESQPGVDEFTSYIKSLYADDSGHEILLSSGDMWQGTVESSLNKGALMTRWMSELGFASMTLGNHEFDWGTSYISQNQQSANFPFLAINIEYNGNPANFCQPSVVVERGDFKVGIIGAIGDCLSSVSGEYQSGLNFITGSRLTSLIKTEATRLRTEEDCDFIVYSQHEGYENNSYSQTTLTQSEIPYYDVSLSNGYIDLVFEGHTHKGYIFKDQYGVLHLQGGGENKYVSKVDLYYNGVTGEYTTSASLLGTNDLSSKYSGDSVVDEIYGEFFPDSDPYTDVLGTLSTTKRSNEITQKVADLYLQTGLKAWGNEYDIVLGGGYLKTRSPYDLYAGKITYADVFSVLPFDNAIVLGSIKGRDLNTHFLQTDNTNYYCSYNGTKPTNIDNSKTYYIVVDSYTSTYGPNKITEVKRLNATTFARDLIAQYIKDENWA